MDRMNEESYQIATLVVVVLTVLSCMYFFLVFVNPQIALNPFRPPLGTATTVAFGLQPTWTPTPTQTPSSTFTPTRTPTITSTRIPTNTPTNTPLATATRRIPTATRRPPTRPPATAAPPAPPAPLTGVYVPVKIGCYHSGGTFIEGTVWSSPNGSPQAGVRVAMGAGPGPAAGDVYYVTSGTQGRSDGYYVHVIRATGASPGNYFVWIADSAGKPLSDPNAGRVTTNNIRNSDDPAACWRAVVDFVRR